MNMEALFLKVQIYYRMIPSMMPLGLTAAQTNQQQLCERNEGHSIRSDAGSTMTDDGAK